MPARKLFQQNNDFKHTFQVVNEWFRVTVTVIWPAQSLDLEHIKTFYGEIKRRLGSLHNCRKLFNDVQEIWHLVLQHSIESLTKSMLCMCGKVVKTKEKIFAIIIKKYQ